MNKLLLVTAILTTALCGCMPDPAPPPPPHPTEKAAPETSSETEQELARAKNSLWNMRHTLEERTASLHEQEIKIATLQNQLQKAQSENRVLKETLERERRQRAAEAVEIREAQDQLVELSELLQGVVLDRSNLMEELETIALTTNILTEELVQRAGVIEAMQQLHAQQVERLEAQRDALAARNQTFTPATERLFSRRRFASMIQGMSTEQLERFIGEPDRIEGSSPERFVYNRALTYAITADDPDPFVTVVVDDGRVVRCIFPE